MKKLGLILLFTQFAILAFGQKAITTTVSKTNVSPVENFKFEISTTVNCPIIKPDFKGFKVLGGPFQSRSQSVQNINGKRTIVSKNSYTYTLRATREGKIILPSVSMDCDGEISKTDPITISVSKNNAQNQKNNGDADFFMRLTSNKRTVYVGESFIVTLKYYSKLKPNSIEALELGDLKGASRKDLNPDRKQYEAGAEIINGINFYTLTLRTELCTAHRKGEITYSPYSSTLVFSRGFFNLFKKETNSNSLTIKSLPVPGSANADFSGLVGEFELTSKISKNTAELGEAIDLKITVKGEGNLQSLGALDLKFPKDFDVFDPEIKDRTSVSRSGIKGQIEYNYILVPTHYGDYTIPAYSFSYFDLDKKKMRTLTTELFKIHVEKPEGDFSEITNSKKTIEAEENTIRYISEEQNGVFNPSAILFGSKRYLLFMLSPLILSILFILLMRKKRAQTGSLKMQQKGAIKHALLGIKETRDHIALNNERLAMKSLQSTLSNFFTQKLNIDRSALSQQGIKNLLETKKVDPLLLQSFNETWSTIEMGQYSPVAHNDLVSTTNNVEHLINELDKQL